MGIECRFPWLCMPLDVCSFYLSAFATLTICYYRPTETVNNPMNNTRHINTTHVLDSLVRVSETSLSRYRVTRACSTRRTRGFHLHFHTTYPAILVDFYRISVPDLVRDVSIDVEFGI